MKKNYLLTNEHILSERYTSEIHDFWQKGTFSTFQGFNDIRINFATFISPEHTKSIVIVQGRSESYIKYQEFIFDIFNQGYNIFIHDHRGQGLSERMLENPHKGYVKSFNDYVHDLDLFITHYVLPFCYNKKPYLLAHSMGCAISCLYLAKYPNIIKSAVLSSPMFGINTGTLPAPIASLIIRFTSKLEKLMPNTAFYFPGQGDHNVKPFKENRLTQSSERYKIYEHIYKHEKAIQLGGVTIQWLKKAHAVRKKILAQIEQITTPILVLQAGADDIVKNDTQDDFCNKLRACAKRGDAELKQLILIDNARHELFFEQDKYRQPAIEHTLDWYDKFEEE